MIVIYMHYMARRDLHANPRVAFLFGDNLLRQGYGGQAKEMRGEPNAIGIPTKKRPSMEPDAFFTDDEFESNVREIDAAFDKLAKYPVVIIPLGGLGAGRAKLLEKAPRTFWYLMGKLKSL